MSLDQSQGRWHLILVHRRKLGHEQWLVAKSMKGRKTRSIGRSLSAPDAAREEVFKMPDLIQHEYPDWHVKPVWIVPDGIGGHMARVHIVQTTMFPAWDAEACQWTTR